MGGGMTVTLRPHKITMSRSARLLIHPKAKTCLFSFTALQMKRNIQRSFSNMDGGASMSWFRGMPNDFAARGFVVFAPDIYSANFMDPYPLEHDPALEADVGAGVDALLARSDISSSRACLYSHTRGGYYTLKVAVTQGRQHTQLACYVSYYPHWQDPNAPEPLQVYGYAPEIDELRLPTMVFIGEKEQYQRRRPIDTGVLFLLSKKRDVSLFVYPGVGRGFDFRPKAVRTLADHLASKDALVRASRFMRKHLGNE